MEINRIRKKALTPQEIAAVRAHEQAMGAKKTQEELEKKLRIVMDEAVPLVEDTQTLDFNVEKLKKQFKNFEVFGKILSTKTVNLAEQVEYEYKGSKVSYPKEYEGAAPEGVTLTTLTEYQIDVKTDDGVVQLHVIPPNWPRNPNDSHTAPASN